MMNNYANHKRTEGKGHYENKEDKNHKVFVYDITHCVDDENTYYSYVDISFGDCRYLSSSKDIFLETFVYKGKEDVKRYEYMNMFKNGGL